MWLCLGIFYLKGMQLLLLCGEELLVHLYATVCTICRGSMICPHWYVRSILRFPLNYSEPRELSCTICIPRHKAQQSCPHFVLFSCKIEGSSQMVCEIFGSLSSWSLHMESGERYWRSEMRNMKEIVFQSLTGLSFSYPQPKQSKLKDETVKGWIRVSWKHGSFKLDILGQI